MVSAKGLSQTHVHIHSLPTHPIPSSLGPAIFWPQIPGASGVLTGVPAVRCPPQSSQPVQESLATAWTRATRVSPHGRGEGQLQGEALWTDLTPAAGLGLCAVVRRLATPTPRSAFGSVTTPALLQKSQCMFQSVGSWRGNPQRQLTGDCLWLSWVKGTNSIRNSGHPFHTTSRLWVLLQGGDDPTSQMGKRRLEGKCVPWCHVTCSGCDSEMQRRPRC